MQTRTSLDLRAIEEEFLNQCGPCDFGMSGACDCATRDYRGTMLDLVREVERLREVEAERDEARRACADLAMQLAAAIVEIGDLRADRNEQYRTLTGHADQARAELASAARMGWIVARDGGRHCLFCGREIRRGEAYELVPGEGPDALRHVHCRNEDDR